ncbi:Acyl-protein synthetase, LuxE [Fodinibius salinus]|uniref:Acyl-protein synthetase, LuxE n=1 Tax=Fodinibius salinus TaxID=860790 RepID=A0A5D3YPK9_9BACT|nr:hypothetical protein [Fodinibius salinus]TYP94973.1 Acyl-protein synthetase, LuxE [Fodinibius salinus]
MVSETMTNWSNFIFSDDIVFEEKVYRLFKYQLEYNPVYQRYYEALGQFPDKDLCHPEYCADFNSISQNDITKIPLLPIKAFKDTIVTTQPDQEADLTFKSSGTSGMQRSVHKVVDEELYKQSLLEGFKQFYGLDNTVIWGYTPGYADNSHSSLIYMIQQLINEDDSGLSCFLPLDEPLDKDAVEKVRESGRQLILFGAAFGLLDLLETNKVTLPSNSIVIETGGMKTHRREISRKQMHQKLSEGFGLDDSRIHSEYGMAELLSQAYTTGGQWFHTVPWMQVQIRNPENPAEVLPPHKEGLIGIIDLANVYSCPFLLTGDKGLRDRKGRFKVMGRWNPKDLRGCNFLIYED